MRKGDVIGQGILKRYETVDNDAAWGERVGGFGSTSKKFVVDKIIDATVYDKYGKCGTVTSSILYISSCDSPTARPPIAYPSRSISAILFA